MPDENPIVKAAKPLNFDDALKGRICSKTKMWVPGHRLKWYMGKPYLDKVCPTGRPSTIDELPGIPPND